VKPRFTASALLQRVHNSTGGVLFICFFTLFLFPSPHALAEEGNRVEVSGSQDRFTHFHEFFAGTTFLHEADVSVKYVGFLTPEYEEERHVDFGQAFVSGYQWHFWDRSYPLLDGGINVSYITARSTDMDMDLYLLTPFFRLKHQFVKTQAEPDGKAAIYAGLGLTYGFADVRIDFRPEIPERINRYAEGLALSYTAGGLWRFTDRYALFVQYQYLDISLDLEDESCLFGCVTGGSIDLVSQEAVAGLSLHF